MLCVWMGVCHCGTSRAGARAALWVGPAVTVDSHVSAALVLSVTDVGHTDVMDFVTSFSVYLYRCISLPLPVSSSIRMCGVQGIDAVLPVVRCEHLSRMEEIFQFVWGKCRAEREI